MKKQFNELQERPAALRRPPRDPDVEALIKVLDGKTTHDVWMGTWVSKSTIRRLRQRITRHPQHSTMITCAGSAGYEYVLRRKK